MAVIRTDLVNDTRMYFFAFASGDVIIPYDTKPNGRCRHHFLKANKNGARGPVFVDAKKVLRS